MADSDGDGWIECTCGSRHWGLHGAAGIVLVHPPTKTALMQLRAEWTHGGQTWGIPGGARDSHETAVEAALRELQEELGVESHDVTVIHDVLLTDHGTWSYHTVIGTVASQPELSTNEESVEAVWVDVHQVGDLDLHPGLAQVWGTIRESLVELVDGL